MKKTKLLLILFAFLAFGQTAWAQVNYIDASGNPATCTSYTVLDDIIAAAPNTDKTIGYENMDNWFVVQGNNVVLNGQLKYQGNMNLILCDGAKLTVTKSDANAIENISNATLTIYVQTNGTGQLVAIASGNKAFQTKNLTIHGGTITATGGTNGIYAPNGDIVINKGTVTASAPNGNAIEGYNVTINGGVVSATGNGGIKNGLGGGRTTLGYTNSSDDQITATSYLLGNDASSVYIKDGQYMITDNGVIVYGWLNEDKRNAIAGRILSPYTPTEWSGHGESDDPYIIDSEDDLILLSLRTGGGSEDYTGKYFRLDADLNFTASTNWDNITSPESNFSAISIFDGHFNGNSHTISGLRLHTNYNFTEQKGLFDRLGPNAYIENLTISNARIAGEKQVGAFAGYAQEGATVTNCHVTGTVAVYAYGNTLQRHGGVVGYNQGTISNCVSEVTISRSPYYAYGSEYVGGIAGYNSGTLSGNKVFGANLTAVSHYGAIAGINNEGTLTGNYYRACTVNGTANSTDVGCDGADVTTNDGALSLHTISVPNTVAIMTEPTLTYNTVNYWAQSKEVTLSGGLGDQPTAGWQKAYFVNNVANTSDPFTPSNTFTITPARDIEITIGDIHGDWANEYNNPTAGSSSDNPYKIYFTDQLDLLATRVNDGTSTYSGKYFKLMDDLTYDNTEQNNYITIGTGSNPFSGHFDGNHKTINGIRIYTNSGYQGVFGYIVDAELKDLNVNDIMISGHDRVGSIVGECDGSSTITGCRVTTATLNATGDSSSQQLFGGIAGRNSGTSTMSNNFVLGINIPQIYHFGAIAGENGGSLISNYYHNYIMNGTAYPTGMGCNSGDVGGAEPVFTVSVPEGVTVTATATVTHNEANYYKEGVTITLSGGLDGSNPNPGCQNAYVVYGQTLTGSNLAPGHEFDMQNANAVVTIGSMPADWAAEQGAGDTEGNPYKIYYKEQLELLATRVNAGESYSGKYFKLMDDLTYDNTQQNNYIAIGTSTHPFNGHFDGNQKTIEGIRIYGTGSYQGVFGYIVDAEVKDLYVNDIEITGHDRVGSIVGECDGSTAISGCRVTTATLNVAGDATYQQLFGGIAGHKSGSTSTMSNNFVLGLTIPQAYHFGAIAGENSTGAQSMVSNHYHNCTVGSTAYPTGVGCNGQDVEGAKAVFTLALADGISTDVEPAVICNTTDYYENGVTINLSYITPANPGYQHIYYVNNIRIDGDSFVLSTNSEVTITPSILINWETAYAGTETDPYLISNVEQWDFLASNVSISGITYSGKFFKLTEDISVTTKVGNFSTSSTIYHPFSGTFDGNGHTLTYTYNVEPANQYYISPFSYINGATIKNLHVTGLIKNQGGKYIGGIAGRAEGTNHITNCRSSVDLQADTPDSGYDVSTGGLLGEIRNGIVYFENCLFDGKIRGYNNASSPAVKWGGFVGWVASEYSNEHAYFTNCVFAPTQINLASTSESYTFARRSENNDLSFTNCYYLSTLGTTQGLKARSISGGENVNVSIAGDAQEYSTSNITAYTSGNMNLIGLKYGNTLYAGKSESVSINLEFTGVLPAHHAPAYTATNATINGTENPYTLNMGNSDNASVVISCDNTILVWEGHGTETDPYLIYTTDQWKLLVSSVNGGNNYSGKYFKLMDDITISETHETGNSELMIGLNTNDNTRFSGNFDGNGHTLTLSINDKSSDYYCGPFRIIKNATIRNLHVTGTIEKTKGKHAGGIVGQAYGTNYLTNCWSSVSITVDTDESNLDGSSGGIIGDMRNSSDPDDTYLIDCLFDGKLLTTNGTIKWGGLVGWVHSEPDAYFINCMFAPTEVSSSITSDANSLTFARGDGDRRFSNCYYKTLIQNAQGNTNASGNSTYIIQRDLGNAWEINNNQVVPIIAEHYTFTGAGTAESPYLITSADDWNGLANDVCVGVHHNGDHFKLTANISELTRMVGTYSNYNDKDFYNAFCGTFDGDGYTLTMNVTNQIKRFAAPFKCVDGATIMNLKTAGTIKSGDTYWSDESKLFGGIVGASWGTTTITNCLCNANVLTKIKAEASLGGLVGAQKTGTLTIEGCAFTGRLGGVDDAQVKQCAGIMCYQFAGSCTISNTILATNAIYTDNNDEDGRAITRATNKTITNCYYSNRIGTAGNNIGQGKYLREIKTENAYITIGNVTNPGIFYYVSGITSYSTGIKYDNKLYAGDGDNLKLDLSYAEPGNTVTYTANYNSTQVTLTETDGNFPFTMPDYTVRITATVTPKEWEGSGTLANPWQIMYSSQLELLATRVNGSESSEYNTKYYKVMNDITYPNISDNHIVIGNDENHKFNGHFDGQGFTISGVKPNTNQNVAKGLFGYLGSSAEVKNVVISNSLINVGRPIGAIAANNEGTVTNCHVTSDVILRASYNTSTIIGGIVGNNQGTISHCSFAGTIDRNHNDYTGHNYEYGGILGGNNSGSNVTDNFVYGATIPAVPSNSGAMTGCGAIFGWHHGGTIARNYYIACNVAGTENAIGVGSGGAAACWDLNADNYPDGAVPGNVRTITGYGSGNGNWAFIASPVVEDLAPNNVTDLLGSQISSNPVTYNYDLYRFNQSGTNGEWENYHNHSFNLENGQGYLYAKQADITLKFIGTTYNTANTLEVPLTYDDNVELAGYNLVGNPFPRAAWVDKPYYKMSDDGSYISATAANTSDYISPCTGVIVRATGVGQSVTFSTTAPGSVGAAPNNGNLNIALAQTTVTRGGNTMKTLDNAIVSFNEGSELGKFYFGHQDANIYIPQGGDEYAIAFSDKHGEMPLNFKAVSDGTYTLTVNPEGTEMAYLHLIDNLTGADVDLLVEPSYTFTGRTTDYTSRFKLVFVANDAQIGGEGSDDFAFISNGQLIVNGTGIVQIVDLLGHALLTRNTDERIGTDGLSAGVYVLRLIDGENVKTQKIVVR